MADILTIADARQACRIPTADTANDADMTATYLPAVTTIVEDVVGPVMTATGLTWTVDGGRVAINLPSAVSAVTQVTETGVTLIAGVDYVVNLTSGVVMRGTMRNPFLFLPGYQNIVITYNAGYAAAPANVPKHITLAARIILRHLWQADQTGGRPQFGTPDGDLVTTPSGFAIPRRAFELLNGSHTVPGFA